MSHPHLSPSLTYWPGHGRLPISRAASAQLYRDAGVDVLGFTGVPVFQAEGLTVKTEKARYTPLFLSKVRPCFCCMSNLPVLDANGKAFRVELRGCRRRQCRANQYVIWAAAC